MPPKSGRPSRERARKEMLESSSNDLFTVLARAGRFLDALQRDCLAEHELAFAEYSVLRLLQRAPDRRLAPSALAEQIVCTSGAMTKIVDRLKRNGFVERIPDLQDRRCVLIEITKAGDARANQAAKTYQHGRERVLELLESRDANDVHDHLALLLDALERDREQQSEAE